MPFLDGYVGATPAVRRPVARKDWLGSTPRQSFPLMPPCDAPAAFPAEGTRLPRHRAGPIVSGDRPPDGGCRPYSGRETSPTRPIRQSQRCSPTNKRDPKVPSPEISFAILNRPISDGYKAGGSDARSLPPGVLVGAEPYLLTLAAALAAFFLARAVVMR